MSPRIVLVVSGVLAFVAACQAGPSVPPTVLPTVPLAVGNKLTAKVQYKTKFDWVEIHGCDALSCNVMWVSGPSSATQDLRFDVFTQADANGADPKEQLTHFKGIQEFEDGELVFVLEHRANQLAVWLQAFPDKVATMPVKDSCDRIRIKGFNAGFNDMKVEYIGLKQ
ncbi:hypothetical protein ONE63_009557 [Megalurothrips usitatus]|uniref:Uncharacterized protein n=1 Tax=Megalurothrips usitatus TaxID=439358 RepID=A0AAV7XJZ5_9NEOP|nr:hypothetical protein ONE63_009557 [Megalurothrips usitatus]